MNEIDQELIARGTMPAPVQELREPHPQQRIIDARSVSTLLAGSGKVATILTREQHDSVIGWLRQMKKHVHPLEALEIARVLDCLRETETQ